MILYIDTIKNCSNDIEIRIIEKGEIKLTKRVKAQFRQSEKLLATIDDLLNRNSINLNKFKKIEVLNSGGSFTALRIGVVTANALGFALGIPVEGKVLKLEDKLISSDEFCVVEPEYDREPNITISKKVL